MLEAVKAGTDAFTGLAAPAAIASGWAGATGASEAAVGEASVTRPVIRASEAATADVSTSRVGAGQTIVERGGGTFILGEEGQALNVSGELTLKSAPRNLKAQTGLPGKLPGDQAGHVIGARFGFEGGRENLVPMAPALNLGAFKKLENHLGRLLQEGHAVSMDVHLVYGENQLRPDKVFVVYTVEAFDGHIHEPGAAQVMEKDEQNAYLDAQAQIYKDLGQALFEMVDAPYQHDWDDLRLEVAQNEVLGQAVHSIGITLALRDGLKLPLIPSAAVGELVRRLDLLARTYLKGRTWRAFSYRLYHGPAGPAYNCDYTYAEGVH